MAGWIKLHRKLLEWEWYDDINTTRLWIHILLRANTEAKKWHGVDVPAGTFITSFAALAEETGLSFHQVRRSMDVLENSQNVARKAANKWQSVTVVNWALYQSRDNETASNTAMKRQTNGIQTATTKEYKNIRTKEPKLFTTPCLDIIQEFVTAHNYDVDAERFFYYYESNGWMVGKNKMKDWKAAVRSWASTNKKPEGGNTNGNDTANSEPLEGTDADGRHWRMWNGYKIYD